MRRVVPKSAEAIVSMQEGGKRLAAALDAVLAEVGPGMTTKTLDVIAEREIRARGAVPAFLGYNGFTGTICASVNDVVVHGIPGALELRAGDIIGVDIGLVWEGYYLDMARTVPVGTPSAEDARLIDVTKEALDRAIAAVRPGVRVGIVGATVEPFIEERGYGVVRDLTGHGIGTRLHEDPPVPNFGGRDFGPTLEAGMTLALEPMVNAGTGEVRHDRDGWTVRTADGRRSAHFEDTILVTEDGAEILTRPH